MPIWTTVGALLGHELDLKPGEAKRRPQAFIARPRREGRGIPALPAAKLANRPGATVVDDAASRPKRWAAPCRCTTCACTARTRAAQTCTFPGSPWPATRPPRRWTSPPTGGGDLPPLQRVALQTHIADLNRVISELQLHDAPDGEEADPADAYPPLQPHHDACRRLADGRPLCELDRRLIDAFDRPRRPVGDHQRRARRHQPVR